MHTEQIVSYATLADFPAHKEVNKFYRDMSTGRLYDYAGNAVGADDPYTPVTGDDTAAEVTTITTDLIINSCAISWSVLGDKCTVFGTIAVSVSAAEASIPSVNMYVTPPVASGFTSTGNCIGVVSGDGSGAFTTGLVKADATDNKIHVAATVLSPLTSTATHTFNFSCVYKILEAEE